MRALSGAPSTALRRISGVLPRTPTTSRLGQPHRGRAGCAVGWPHRTIQGLHVCTRHRLSSVSAELLRALDGLLSRGQELVRDSSRSHDQRIVRLVADEEALIETLLRDAAADSVRSALARLGAPDDERRRTIDEEALHFSGVARALARHIEFDVPQRARELAQYLTGPNRVEDWVALTAGVPNGRCGVAGGFEFGRFQEDELWGVLPLPTVARALDRRDPFRPDVWRQVAFLRRATDRLAPAPGALYLNFGPDSDMDELWAPLLALSLWSNHPIGLGGRWTIDVGSAYREERRPSLEFVPSSSSDDDDDVILADWETLYCIDDQAWNWFVAFQQAIAERIDALPAGRARRRLEYAARHFLAATSLGSGPGADVWREEEAAYPERTLEAMFRYCATLEATLGDGAGELTRKVSQRAALVSSLVSEARLPMFAGEVDDPYAIRMPDVLIAAGIVKKAYEGRSKFSHGDEPPKDLWNRARIPQLRLIVRASLLGGLILDNDSETDSLPSRCDEALLSADSRDALVNSIGSFVSDVEGRVVSLRAT